MDEEKLLLAEYQSFTESFWKNEETGEKRVEFFITLMTAVIAGIVTLYSTKKLSEASFLNIATGALSATLLFGFVTFLRIMRRNRVTEEYIGILNYLREKIKERSANLSEYKLPFRKDKRWLKGGLAETIALMNSIILGVILSLRKLDWYLVVIFFVISFFLQITFSKKDRDKEKEKNTAKVKQAPGNLTFRAGTGAVITNDEGLVLGLERCDIPGAWQFPQGGVDEGEAPLETVKREILEETGIKAERLELLATASRWLAYELPEEARNEKIGRGQVQRWFLFRFKGSEAEITLGDQKEFKRWQWITMDEIVSKIVAFKKPVYEELANEFKAYLREA